MFRKTISFLLLVALIPAIAIAAPRAYGAWGTATDVNTAIVLPFNPSGGCVYNDSTTDEYYINIVTGVATTASGSTNIKVLKGEKFCWGSNDSNVSNVFTIGIICASGKTVPYRLSITRFK